MGREQNRTWPDFRSGREQVGQKMIVTRIGQEKFIRLDEQNPFKPAKFRQHQHRVLARLALDIGGRRAAQTDQGDEALSRERAVQRGGTVGVPKNAW